MKRLTLMGHGDAQWKDPGIADFDRPLNRRGLAESEAMARRLTELALVPTRLLSSSARRAQQTTAVVARELGLLPNTVRCQEALYLAAADDILQLIKGTGPRIPHLMIVGHNPGLSEVAGLLDASSSSSLDTAAIRTLTFEVKSWTDIGRETLRDSLGESPPQRRFALWA